MGKDAKTKMIDNPLNSPATENQGEGDRKSAERFNTEEQKFVESAHGREMIEKAGQVEPSEEGELKDAERDGRTRAKGEDPAVSRKT